tara:strand:- start:1235 stop:1471 length:237 start_codon:yes stop_codon:yes gene_type:complete
MISRNAKYEKAMREAGRIKLTVWVPAAVAPDFKLAASLCCLSSDLTVSQLRNVRTGRFLSIHTAPVTGDALSTETVDN